MKREVVKDFKLLMPEKLLNLTKFQQFVHFSKQRDLFLNIS